MRWLYVKFRLFINLFDKQFWFFVPPRLEGLNRASVVQSTLRYAVVIGVQIKLERLVQLRSAREPRLRHQVADAPIETLDHAVRLRVAGRAKPGFDSQRLAGEGKHMLTRSLLASAGKTIRELAAVVGQQRLDHHRCYPPEASQEVGAADLGLIAVGAKVDPARGPVDGDKQVPAARLVGHLRQVLDVHVDEA